MRLLTTVSLVSLLVIAGCKKDKKTSEASKPTAASTDKPTDKPATAGTEKKPAPKPATVASAGTPKLSGDVILVVGMAGIDQLWKLVEAKAKKFKIPLPITKDLAMMQLQAVAKFKSMKWLDTTRPLLAVAGNPKSPSAQGGDGIGLVPITSAENLSAGMPEGTAKPGTSGVYEVSLGSKKIYIKVIKNYAAIAPSEALFTKLKPFLEGFVGKWQPSGVFDVQVSISILFVLPFSADHGTGPSIIGWRE